MAPLERFFFMNHLGFAMDFTNSSQIENQIPNITTE